MVVSSGNSTITERRHLSTGSKIARESGGFLIAEAASMATGLGVVAIIDSVIPKPIMKFAAKALGKTVVEPFLDPIEKCMSKICKLEECQPDPSKSREERAEGLARTMMVFGLAYVLSMEAKLHTRRAMNKLVGVLEELPHGPAANASFWQKVKHYGTLSHWSPQEKMIFAADEGVHIGSLYLLNNSLAPFTDEMIKSTSKMLQRTTGMDEKKAHEVASMAWVWEAANGLGAVAGIGAIAGKHALGWPRGVVGKAFGQGSQPASHVEKLAEQTALASTLHTPRTT
jgi:hypothetical protein